MALPKVIAHTFYKQNLINNAIRCSLSNRKYSDWVPKPNKTHTDQQWDADDYRNVRFIDKPKHVNTNFSIKLINEVPPKPTKARVIACDGGGGPLGHPKVYINLDKPGNHTCGYCGLRFVKEEH
ncbi:NADH dehydrogenase [ubiquinone] iron-sulfur protein 6, mitochondrial [Chrysoperla carnea]|uniref:NADH dehydrogenase [ubiquinone] iron-sulfur protein 6, mitochondrial n=1 Tax=Chrysoperla carnea TaxID=189513 RepID=UPI001D0645CC|nr:NADH dehydrogenase [ubiquinone] iron-sulfur protein 6, mitochondrial [Chrysoperla carnea]